MNFALSYRMLHTAIIFHSSDQKNDNTVRSDLIDGSMDALLPFLFCCRYVLSVRRCLVKNNTKAFDLPIFQPVIAGYKALLPLSKQIFAFYGSANQFHLITEFRGYHDRAQSVRLTGLCESLPVMASFIFFASFPLNSMKWAHSY